jgi:predicted nucleotidyltransferase
MIIGAVAASLRGQARATEDVDISVVLDEDILDRFLDLARAEGLRPRIPDAIAFAKRRAVLLLEHEPTRIGVDVTIGRLPFEREAVARAQDVVIQGMRVPVATSEDLVVMKAVAHRPQDLQDIRAIVVANPRLDVARIRANVGEFARALDMPELWTDIQPLLSRAKKPRKPARRKRPKK